MCCNCCISDKYRLKYRRLIGCSISSFITSALFILFAFFGPILVLKLFQNLVTNEVVLNGEVKIKN